MRLITHHTVQQTSSPNGGLPSRVRGGSVPHRMVVVATAVMMVVMISVMVVPTTVVVMMMVMVAAAVVVIPPAMMVPARVVMVVGPPAAMTISAPIVWPDMRMPVRAMMPDLVDVVNVLVSVAVHLHHVAARCRALEAGGRHQRAGI